MCLIQETLSTDTVLVFTGWFLLYALSLIVRGGRLPSPFNDTVKRETIQKLATCFETLLQNELNTHVARSPTNQTCLATNQIFVSFVNTDF